MIVNSFKQISETGNREVFTQYGTGQQLYQRWNEHSSVLMAWVGTTHSVVCSRRSKNEFVPKLQTESLELLHSISHQVCCLGQSVPHLPSCILVTVGSSTLTRPASPAAYQMSVQSVEWHYTP